MTRLSNVPRIWDILKSFKDSCQQKGWKISDYEDIVKIDDEYHGFIGTRSIHPSTFKRIMSNKKRALPEGKSYHVVDVAYTAWVFQQQPSEQLVKTLTTNPELTRKTALYDLSEAYEGAPLCRKLNETGSCVFHEFEKFLKENYGVETKPLYEPRTTEPKTFKSKLLKASLG
ncbi:MAG: hypothetical protein NWE82_03420 [Candidatus Bathyarchaeota archaeon]|jgi:hypothetical protein|nr:hypothetical protein [Candidatus Bathyarchaeota archaeon]